MGLLRIALLCIIFGTVSIPISFTINSSPVIVWLGNGLGSLLSAMVLIYIGDRIDSTAFKEKLARWRAGKRILRTYEGGQNNKDVKKAGTFINRHGLRIFAFFTPIFPGVFIATSAVYLLGLNRRTYKRWLVAGIFFASGAYVFGYWWVFIR